jgi:aminomethyltransferase
VQSPLFEWHLEVGAKLSDFGGWQMPIEYPKAIGAMTPGGVIAEHTAVREIVGIFDVSHLGKIEVSGIGALQFLNRMISNDLNRIGHGSAQYNLLCDPSGGVVDDLIVYRYDDEKFFLVPNASNCARVFEILKSENDLGLTIKNAHHQYGVLAVQGPLSKDLLAALGVVVELDYMAFTEVTIPDHESLGNIIVCRTGYTGEFGYELIPSWNATLPLWELLVSAAEVLGGRVCGLGARDTLRTEMGYPLHGHELSLDISPLQANAGWAVVLTKSDFRGRDALVREKEIGVARILRGLLAQDRGIPRGEMNVLDAAGMVVGVVTSGTFSPTLKIGIGLALIKPDIAIGTELTIDVRGRSSAVKVVKPPFMESHVR